MNDSEINVNSLFGDAVDDFNEFIDQESPESMEKLYDLTVLYIQEGGKPTIHLLQKELELTYRQAYRIRKMLADRGAVSSEDENEEEQKQDSWLYLTYRD